jgi:hypothetical protein
MPFKPVRSSNIHGLDYDATTKNLTVHFKNGAQYTYQNVPEQVATQYLQSGSPRRFHNEFIHGKYGIAASNGPPAKRTKQPNTNSKVRIK